MSMVPCSIKLAKTAFLQAARLSTDSTQYGHSHGGQHEILASDLAVVQVYVKYYTVA